MSGDKEAVGRWSINTKALWEDFGFKVIPKESMPPDLVAFIEDYLRKSHSFGGGALIVIRAHP